MGHSLPFESRERQSPQLLEKLTVPASCSPNVLMTCLFSLRSKFSLALFSSVSQEVRADLWGGWASEAVMDVENKEG